MGSSFFTTPGGKGANQAVAAARLSDQVYMIGAVGDDDYGQQILSNLNENSTRTFIIYNVHKLCIYIIFI